MRSSAHFFRSMTLLLMVVPTMSWALPKAEIIKILENEPPGQTKSASGNLYTTYDFEIYERAFDAMTDEQIADPEIAKAWITWHRNMPTRISVLSTREADSTSDALGRGTSDSSYISVGATLLETELKGKRTTFLRKMETKLQLVWTKAPLTRAQVDYIIETVAHWPDARKVLVTHIYGSLHDADSVPGLRIDQAILASLDRHDDRQGQTAIAELVEDRLESEVVLSKREVDAARAILEDRAKPAPQRKLARMALIAQPYRFADLRDDRALIQLWKALSPSQSFDDTYREYCKALVRITVVQIEVEKKLTWERLTSALIPLTSDVREVPDREMSLLSVMYLWKWIRNEPLVQQFLLQEIDRDLALDKMEHAQSKMAKLAECDQIALMLLPRFRELRALVPIDYNKTARRSLKWLGSPTLQWLRNCARDILPPPAVEDGWRWYF